jgi:histidinol-phosphatase (PHP family)
MDTMIRAAIGYGFRAIGFSEHSYAPLQSSYCMPPEKTDDYFREIREARERYKGKIRVFGGFELDKDSELPDDRPDYIIASVHELMCGDINYPVDWSESIQRELAEVKYGGDMFSVWQEYYGEVVRHVERSRPDIIGHFDLITKYSLVDESDPGYMELAAGAAVRCMETCDTFELNTGAIARHLRTVPYPADFILRKIKEKGCRVIITSDCHFPDRMTCWFSEAEDYLGALGFRQDPHADLNEKVKDIEIWY